MGGHGFEHDAEKSLKDVFSDIDSVSSWGIFVTMNKLLIVPSYHA